MSMMNNVERYMKRYDYLIDKRERKYKIGKRLSSEEDEELRKLRPNVFTPILTMFELLHDTIKTNQETRKTKKLQSGGAPAPTPAPATAVLAADVTAAAAAAAAIIEAQKKENSESKQSVSDPPSTDDAEAEAEAEAGDHRVKNAVLPCGHTDCFPCLTAWIRRKHQCHVCRCPAHHAIKLSDPRASEIEKIFF